MSTDFQNSFTVRLNSKHVMKHSLNIPSHLKCVATLPCENKCQETTDNLKQMSCLTINFNLNLLQSNGRRMFWLIYVALNIQKCPLMARMQAWRCLRHWSMSSSITLLHSNSRINQIPHQIIHILRFLRFFSGGLVAPDFVMKCNEARNLEVHAGLVHYRTFGHEATNGAQNVKVDTARGKVTTSRIYQKW